MLLSSFFIVEAEDLAKLSVDELPEHTHVVFKIASNKLSESTFYSQLFKSNIKFPFCLLIDITQVPQNENSIQTHLNALIAFTFHYKYIKTGYGEPLIIFQSQPDGVESYITAVQEALYGQGYEKIDPLIVKNEQLLSWPTNEKKGVLLPLTANTDSISADYLKILQATDTPGSYFFKVNTPEKLGGIISAFQQTEATFLQQHPQQYHLLQRLNKRDDQYRQLFIQHGLLQEKLESQARYNSFYKQADERYKKQILEIVDFYKKEYEILPLWFKQLGHVVKVLTGKRTFKSLYNDNVKKYKE